jgi:hypothetical protein
MIWGYEFINISTKRQEPRVLGGGTFFARDLEAAKATAESALRNVTAAGATNLPDAVRLLDQSGKEIWRSRREWRPLRRTAAET